MSQAYEALGKAYAGNHEYQEAYMAFAKYDQLKSAVFTAEADQRISLLQTEFEVAEKESTIQSQISRIRKQTTIQTLTIIVIGLLGLYLVLLFKAVKNNTKKNRQLHKQNKENEFLLKEIHHRVKNNLEIVSSLLSLQSAQIDDPSISEAMLKSQQRVQSMSMIHKKLYQGKSLAAIEMKDYFKNLGNYIFDLYGVEDRITYICPMEPIELDVDMAIPIGLIVNELLTNSLKYAFPNGASGQIEVSLEEIDSILHLKVADNGIGSTIGEPSRGTGFGTKLIRLLTKQLDGKMVLNTNQGTSVSIQFQPRKAA